MTPPPLHPWFARPSSLGRPQPRARTLIRTRITASASVQHLVEFRDGDTWATITIEASSVSFPEPLDSDGYPTSGCAEWLISAADFACGADGRPRLIIWPDRSSTSLAPRHPPRHYPPPQHKHLSEHEWPPIRWWRAQ
jgi:hypothetical protein